ncbi:glycoside hydrolase family 3 protein [Arsenicitalea aurantiaca]|uniref:beta-N-acetylhexosaminidase n=1 Tax=Arsenicitalea aurantiaca TaxID=1783274 RepID=A0A433XGC5_9HYPH|nr:glycoside hydrolase family 3 N-terminal domain-containing protein [Arsenicitalea aurantiaca]RUT33159.1 glycoside hydrolase family 3 protein [Arsenicitalea aurantiaca]
MSAKPLHALAVAGALGVAFLPTLASAQSLEEMAGQMVAVGFQGASVDAPDVARLRQQIAAGEIGGVMFLRINVESLDAVRAMNAAFHEASPDLPPFITLDQEGGAVERLTEAVGFREIPNAREIAAANSPDAAEAIYARMAAGIADVGFTVNFGPVVDLDTNPDNQVISRYGRAFAADPETVTAYAEAFIEAHRQAGLLTSLKHFPGHGSSTADSHEGFVDITETWDEAELDPYRTLIGQGMADFVMIGHLFHSGYADARQLPSSLSPQWITGVLRDELGYDGVVISDDLEMGAIREHYSLEETVVLAVEAGMDVLLFSNTADYRPTLGDEIRAILVAEGEADPAFAARIEESYRRILALKARLPG